MFRSIRQLHLYYASIVSITLISLIVGTYYLNRVRPEKILLDFESLANLENLEENLPLDNIVESILKDRPRKSLKILDELNKDSLEINETIRSEEYKEFQRESQKVEESLHQLVANPGLSSIFPVLSEKVNQFKNYVTMNGWKTLTRISERTARRVQSLALGGGSTLEENNLRDIYPMLKRDLKAMEQVTSSSRLNAENKKRILSMLSSWEVELDMIGKHIDTLVSFSKIFASFNESYTSWYNTVIPKAVVKKLTLEENSGNAILSMILFSFFLFSTLIGGWFLHKRIGRSIAKSQEKSTLDLIQHFLIPLEGEVPGNFSQGFQFEVRKLKQYLQKRMSYGAIFQEATPFSAFLLGSDLNLIWGNDLFYKTWNLKKNNQGHLISWDYLQQFTNLGENDPIGPALKNAVAGIYNIQIKVKEAKASLPYEMYVSPVQYLGQKRIMIFLYPLRSMEETLSDQAKALIGPVSRNLDALIGKNYTDDFAFRIQKDFEVAGIEYVHKKFLSYNDLVTHEKEQLMDEIKKLENEIADMHKFLDDVKGVIGTIEISNKEMVSLFSSVKKAFIDSAQFCTDTFNSYKRNFDESKHIWDKQDDLLNHSLNMNGIFKESAEAMRAVLRSRQKFKEIITMAEDFKYSLSQAIDRSLLSQKKRPSPIRNGRG